MTGLRPRTPTEEPYITTEKRHTSSTQDPDSSSKTPIDDDPGAMLCYNLQRMAHGAYNNVMMKIGMCFSSVNSRKATLVARVGQEVYKETVQLPFDAASKIGQYRIDWHPDSIVWKVDRQTIGTLNERISSVPDKAMRIKLYVAPKDPTQSPSDTLVEHQLELFLAGYQKYENPIHHDELRFTLTEPSRYNHKLIIIIASAFVALFFAICYHCKQRAHIELPNGYETLLNGDGEEQHLGV